MELRKAKKKVLRGNAWKFLNRFSAIFLCNILLLCDGAVPPISVCCDGVVTGSYASESSPGT